MMMMMMIKSTAIALAIVSVALFFGIVPAPVIHFPGILLLTLLVCVVLILTLGIHRPHKI